MSTDALMGQFVFPTELTQQNATTTIIFIISSEERARKRVEMARSN
jgi:hypothetical protein